MFHRFLDVGKTLIPQNWRQRERKRGKNAGQHFGVPSEQPALLVTCCFSSINTLDSLDHKGILDDKWACAVRARGGMDNLLDKAKHALGYHRPRLLA